LDFLIGLKLAEEEEYVVFAFDRMSLAREVSIVSVSFLTFAFETLGRLGVAAGVGAVAEGVASRGDAKAANDCAINALLLLAGMPCCLHKVCNSFLLSS